jgi:hypothetical protein
MFLSPALSRGWDAILLYVLTPGIAAGGGGALVGRRLLRGGRTASLEGAGLGLLAAAVAHVFFGPLFAAQYWLLEQVTGSSISANPLGTALAVTWVGFLATAVLTLPVGAIAGALLAACSGRSTA